MRRCGLTTIRGQCVLHEDKSGQECLSGKQEPRRNNVDKNQSPTKESDRACRLTSTKPVCHINEVSSAIHRIDEKFSK